MAVKKVPSKTKIITRVKFDRSLKEDCIGFNPAKIRVRRINRRWKIVEGSHWILDFEDKESEAYTAYAIIENHGMNSICFVGRPNPSMTYFLSNGNAPVGAMSGEDAISFRWNKIEVKKIQGRWKIVEGSHWMMDFGSKRSEANAALAILKKYRFNKMCFVGRPKPSMTYFLRGPADGWPRPGVLPAWQQWLSCRCHEVPRA